MKTFKDDKSAFDGEFASLYKKSFAHIFEGLENPLDVEIPETYEEYSKSLSSRIFWDETTSPDGFFRLIYISLKTGISYEKLKEHAFQKHTGLFRCLDDSYSDMHKEVARQLNENRAMRLMIEDERLRFLQVNEKGRNQLYDAAKKGFDALNLFYIKKLAISNGGIEASGYTTVRYGWVPKYKGETTVIGLDEMTYNVISVPSVGDAYTIKRESYLKVAEALSAEGI